jgi:hypothetical protein
VSNAEALVTPRSFHGAALAGKSTDPLTKESRPLAT